MIPRDGVRLLAERTPHMERTLDNTRILETEVKMAPRSVDEPDNGGLLVWVVDMASHRVVRRRVGRRAEQKAALHSER